MTDSIMRANFLFSTRYVGRKYEYISHIFSTVNLSRLNRDLTGPTLKMQHGVHLS